MFLQFKSHIKLNSFRGGDARREVAPAFLLGQTIWLALFKMIAPGIDPTEE